MEPLIITEKNLFVNNRCRFCEILKGSKHIDCFHGMGDLLGTRPLDIEYEGDQK
jgi:hypothetical protein